MAYLPRGVPIAITTSVTDRTIRSYSFNFVAAVEDIVVTLNEAVVDSTLLRVSINLDGQGGVVRFLSSAEIPTPVELTVGQTIVISRNTPVTRATTFSGRGYPSNAAVETHAARVERILQEIVDLLNHHEEVQVSVDGIKRYALQGGPGITTTDLDETLHNVINNAVQYDGISYSDSDVFFYAEAGHYRLPVREVIRGLVPDWVTNPTIPIPTGKLGNAAAHSVPGTSIPDASSLADGRVATTDGGVWGSAEFTNDGNVDFDYNSTTNKFSARVAFPKQARHVDTAWEYSAAAVQRADNRTIFPPVGEREFTEESTSYYIERIFFDSSDNRLGLYIGSGGNPSPNPAGIDLHDYRLDLEVGSTVHTFHLNEAWFEPVDVSGEEHEWEWRNAPADLLPLLQITKASLYRPITSVNYVATPDAADDEGDVYTLGAGKVPQWAHPHAPTIRTYDQEDVDSGHDFKLVALEEAEPKSATAAFDSTAVMEWQASVTVDPTHTGSLILGLPAGSGTNPGRWTLNISPTTTPVELWGQAATHLRMRFSSDGAAYGNWVEYPIEIDTSVGNALPTALPRPT